MSLSLVLKYCGRADITVFLNLYISLFTLWITVFDCTTLSHEPLVLKFWLAKGITFIVSITKRLGTNELN